MAGEKLDPSPLTWLGGERRLARRVGRPVRDFLAIDAASGVSRARTMETLLALCPDDPRAEDWAHEIKTISPG